MLKRKSSLYIILFSILTLFSCTGPMGEPGRDGKDGEESIWKIITVTIEQNDWKLVDDQDGNPIYAYDTYIPEITNFAYTDGNVFTYLILDPAVENKESQSLLPYEIPRMNDKNEQWTEYYSSVFYPEGMIFYAIYSDFAVVGNPPPRQEYRVVVNY